MAGRTSIVARSVLAIVLTVVFYAGSILAVVGLYHLGIAAANVKDASPLAPLVPFIVAGMLVWSIIPRRIRFVVPGPLLDPAESEGLYALIADVARSIPAPMPHDVYLLADANAFVAKAGGFLGFGGRRVIGVGLPLLAALDREALRAVIVHEFGHFHGGDVRLGPWIYGTRESIARASSTLGQVRIDFRLQIAAALVRIPFVLYAELYRRITLAVSRRQELSADALAARLVGTEATARGLRAVPILVPSWTAYLQTEVSRVLDVKRRPPLAAGYRKFLAAPAIRTAASEVAKRSSVKPSPYDSHPPVDVRIRAIGASAVADTDAELPARESSLDALGDVDSAEAALLTFMLRSREVLEFPRTRWSDVVADIVLPEWRSSMSRFGGALVGRRVESLPTSVAALQTIGRELARAGRAPGRNAVPIAVSVLAGALGSLLVREGGIVASPLGEPTTVTLRGQVVDVVGVVRDLAERRLSPEAWSSRCRELGILGAPFVRSAATATA